MPPQAIDRYLAEHRDQFEADLGELLRIPSVSADSRHAGDVRRAAAWLAAQFQKIGLATETIETAGFPLIYAESPKIAAAPTVLVYGHYDVQPPDPLDEWITPPFEPAVRDGNIYARGATDDKGQMLTHVKSAEAWMESIGHLPINLKFLIEGEEEVGSQNLEDYLAANREKLACDCVVISDTSQFGPGRPAITCGLRGIIAFELILRGPKQDLHSGSFGGAIVNPANALAGIIADLHDEQGRVAIPGFYDNVLPLSGEERRQFEELPFDEAAFYRQFGLTEGGGEQGFTNLERRWARPTCDVNGLTSGYQGEGPKTIIPAWARAKFSIRLVPKQDPAKISEQVRRFVEDRCPAGVRCELQPSHGSAGVVVSRESPYVAAAARAIEHGFGRPPVYIREGGSIPIVTDFAQQLRAEVLLLGWGLPDDNTHSPNEKLNLADFHRGIQASAALWQELAKSAE